MHLIDLKTAAKNLSITERHLRELVYRDAVPYYKIGRLLRFDSVELVRWVKSNRNGRLSSGDEVFDGRHDA